MKKRMSFLVVCVALFSLLKMDVEAANCPANSTIAVSVTSPKFVEKDSGDITFYAAGSPAGGTYSWSLTSAPAGMTIENHVHR